MNRFPLTNSTTTPISTPAPTIDEKRSQFRLIVIITTSLLTVLLVVLYTTSYLLTTSFESLTLLGILLTIYLIFIRQCYVCMIGYHQKTIRRRRPSSSRGYSSFRRFNAASNNIEISMTSSDAANFTTEVVSCVNTSDASVPENMSSQVNRYATTETMYVALPTVDGGPRSPGPPSYDEAVRGKPRSVPPDEKPPNYSEAMKNIVKQK